MDSFNLYREAKDNYSKLIPDRNDGLIILSLFSKYKDKNFTEGNIISIINKVYRDSGSDNKKMFFERDNGIILRLQESFIWRDKKSKTYHFKKYGLEFCENVENRLEKNYNPAKIKRWFDELHNSLVKTIEDDGDFNIWITDHFDVRRHALASQIEILDQQVNKSVLDFKCNIKSKTDDILATLEQIEFGLGIIKEQSKELKNAFSISYDIDDILTSILEKGDAIDYIENIKKVQDFHNKSRNHLEQVSWRIEKIKPQIREFIYNFNRREFDRKTDEFIQFLLKNSTIKKSDSKKEIVFPLDIPIPVLKNQAVAPRLTVIPVKDFVPKLPTKIPRRTVNNQGKSILISKTKKWKKDKDRILYWCKAAFLEIESQEVFYFPPFFFNIIEHDGFAIAVKTAHKILREASKEGIKYKITVLNKPFIPTKESNITIWQMKIQKK